MMERFISMRLFPALREAMQTGIDARPEVLENIYVEFAGQVLTGDIAYTNRKTYRHALVYTRAELAGLTSVPGKKCRNLSVQGH
ncbi:hypothetical protein FACS1894179_03620 [Bacteroidia bacterium]|nr:hypothetical protein FACS1894179_03620 [Bacteroidia bacterium]